MSYTSTISSGLVAADVRPIVQNWRVCGQLVGAALQTVGFAAVMWLALSGPGFLADAPGVTAAIRAIDR